MTDSKSTNENPLKDDVVAALRQVFDPEIPINVYELGLIYDLEFETSDAVRIKMTLTAPNCPMAEVIVQDVTTKVQAVDGIEKVEVELVWEPKWDPDMMSEAAKLDMEFTGHVGPAHLRKDKFASLTINRSKSHRAQDK